MLLKVLILFFLYECDAVLHSFGIDYIGNQTSVEQYKESNICLSNVCVIDAKRYVAQASYRIDAHPCVSFKEFACGHFNEFRVTSDRYGFIGFENELERQYQHRLKRILRLKIRKDEPKIFRIIKSYFQKCVNSDYVRSEGKSEIYKLLSEFGKFPALEANWNPLDFNVTKALTVIENDLTSSYYGYVDIEEMLHFELCLTRELALEISKDSETVVNTFLDILRSFNDYNDQKELKWFKIIEDLNRKKETNVELTDREQSLSEFLDINYRRKLANSFMVQFLTIRVQYFSVYPKTTYNKRALNRYETCIEEIQKYMYFPLEVMFELEHSKNIDKEALKVFWHKALLMEYEFIVESNPDVDQNKLEELKNETENIPIYIGFPDELTNTEFLNKLYSNLNLTGQEGVYEMDQKMKEFHELLEQKEFNSTYLKNLSKNAKEIFQNCNYNKKLDCTNTDEEEYIVFTVQEMSYPVFHANRSYFVNLPYFYDRINIYLSRKISNVNLTTNSTISYNGTMQRNYKKYLENFGPESILPGFLLTNQQMMEVIRYQSKCEKYQDGSTHSKYCPKEYIFNCAVDEEYNC